MMLNVKASYRFRRFDEDFAFAQLIFSCIHVDCVHDDFYSSTWFSFPRRPCLFADNGVPVVLLKIEMMGLSSFFTLPAFLSSFPRINWKITGIF